MLHVERNKVDVSSHVKSSLYLFNVTFYLYCLNSWWTGLILPYFNLKTFCWYL